MTLLIYVFIYIAAAEAFKDDGNYEFKKKKYDVAIENYTEGIKIRCPDKLLNAILYTNRAAAQYHRGNKLIIYTPDSYLNICKS